jgi:hypothetical protein
MEESIELPNAVMLLNVLHCHGAKNLSIFHTSEANKSSSEV